MYKLEDFSCEYGWVKFHNNVIYSLWKSCGTYRLHINGSETVLGVHNLHQAKNYVKLVYGVPTKDWFSFGTRWKTSGYKWQMEKSDPMSMHSPYWTILFKSKQITDKKFRSRQKCIDWINSYEQGLGGGAN